MLQKVKEFFTQHWKKIAIAGAAVAAVVVYLKKSKSSKRY